MIKVLLLEPISEITRYLRRHQNSRKVMYCTRLLNYVPAISFKT